jgi:hypothetical protein
VRQLSNIVRFQLAFPIPQYFDLCASNHPTPVDVMAVMLTRTIFALPFRERVYLPLGHYYQQTLKGASYLLAGQCPIWLLRGGLTMSLATGW